MSGYGQTTVAIDALRPTEAADPQVIAALADDIRSAGELRQPILVESRSSRNLHRGGHNGLAGRLDRPSLQHEFGLWCLP